MTFNYEEFKIDKRPAGFRNSKGNFQRAHGQSMIVVTDKNGLEYQVNGKVSDNYRIHQPFEVLEQFKKVSEHFDLDIKTVITNPVNAGMIISAEYTQTQFANEDHKVNVVFFTSHDGKHKTFLTLNALRLACMNQVPMLYEQKNRFLFSEKHYANSLDVDKIAPVLESIPDAVNSYNSIMEQLSDKEFSYENFIEFMKQRSKVDEDSSHYIGKLNFWEEAYFQAEGQDVINDNTAYKALHAITWINTHKIRDTAQKNENRLIKKSNDSALAIRQLLAA